MRFPFTWYSWSHAEPSTAIEHRAWLFEALFTLLTEHEDDGLEDVAYGAIRALLCIEAGGEEEPDLRSDLESLSEYSEQLYELDGTRGLHEAWDFALDRYRAELDGLVRLSFITERGTGRQVFQDDTLMAIADAVEEHLAMPHPSTVPHDELAPRRKK